MRVPWYQRTIRVLAAISVGVVAFGSLLSALSNAFSLITPNVTYVGTAAMFAGFAIVSIAVWRRPLAWVSRAGTEVRIKRVGPSGVAFVVGIVVLLWAPRLFTNKALSEQARPQTQATTSSDASKLAAEAQREKPQVSETMSAVNSPEVHVEATARPNKQKSNHEESPASGDKSTNTDSAVAMPAVVSEAAGSQYRVPAGMPSFFRAQAGTLIYQDGGVQDFDGFRCMYSGRLYYSRTSDALSSTSYRVAPSIELGQLARIDFPDHSDRAARSARIAFRNGRVLDAIYVYAGECSWWAEPGMQGYVSEPALSSVVFNYDLSE